jgi:hypothetical protein
MATQKATSKVKSLMKLVPPRGMQSASSQQKVAFEARCEQFRKERREGKLSQTWIDELESVGFDWQGADKQTKPIGGYVDVTTIRALIADHELSTEEKYESFRTKYPELKLPHYSKIMKAFAEFGEMVWNVVGIVPAKYSFLIKTRCPHGLGDKRLCGECSNWPKLTRVRMKQIDEIEAILAS